MIGVSIGVLIFAVSFLYNKLLNQGHLIEAVENYLIKILTNNMKIERLKKFKKEMSEITLIDVSNYEFLNELKKLHSLIGDLLMLINPRKRPLYLEVENE